MSFYCGRIPNMRPAILTVKSYFLFLQLYKLMKVRSRHMTSGEPGSDLALELYGCGDQGLGAGGALLTISGTSGRQ